MVYCRRPQDEPRNIGRHFLPAIVLQHLALVSLSRRFGVVRAQFGGEDQFRVGDSRGADFEGLAHELVLCVDLRYALHRKGR